MLSDTKDRSVRSSCRESRRSVPSFEFALQSIKSLKGTNQGGDEQHGGTLDFTYMGGYDGLWGKRCGRTPLCGHSALPEIH